MEHDKGTMLKVDWAKVNGGGVLQLEEEVSLDEEEGEGKKGDQKVGAGFLVLLLQSFCFVTTVPESIQIGKQCMVVGLEEGFSFLKKHF